MLPFVTSQAIALGKMKSGPARAAAPAKPTTTAPATPSPLRPRLLRRIVDALIPARLRRPEKST
jgi:hypothetical protein